MIVRKQRQPDKMAAMSNQSAFGCSVGICILLFSVNQPLAQSLAPVQLKRPGDPVAQQPIVPPQPSANQDIEKAPEQRLQDVDNALKAAQNKRRLLNNKASGLDGDIKELRAGMVSAARLIQKHEKRVDELTKELARVNYELAVKDDTLRKRRKQMGVVLQALQRVAQYPPEALIAQPISPGDTVRTAILLRSTMPELARRALDLKDDLDALQFNKAEAQRRREELNEANLELLGQRKQLQTLLGRKSRMRRRTVSESAVIGRKAKALSKKARSLRDLMQRLEVLRQQREQLEKDQKSALKRGNKEAVAMSEPPQEYTGKAINIAKGKLPYPVVGEVNARFGQKASSGLTHKGVTIDTVSEAQVIVPYEGRVAFTGPFRGYGRLLIIEHGAGYHTLLAGMGRIDVAVGQWVLGGEPVGIMDRVENNNKGRKPSLYMELRREGQPINPLPWLVVRGNHIEKSKVSG